jgi:hypothetical protein
VQGSIGPGRASFAGVGIDDCHGSGCALTAIEGHDGLGVMAAKGNSGISGTCEIVGDDTDGTARRQGQSAHVSHCTAREISSRWAALS